MVCCWIFWNSYNIHITFTQRPRITIQLIVCKSINTKLTSYLFFFWINDHNPRCKCDRSVFDNTEVLKEGVSGALVTALILGVHEISHILVAKEAGVKLGVPFFVPSWQVRFFN